MSNVTFTPEQQVELNRMFADRAKRGRESGINELLEELGIENVDALKATLADAKKLKESQPDVSQTLADKEKVDAQAQMAAVKAENEKLRKRQAFSDAARNLQLNFSSPRAESDAFAVADLSQVTIEGEAVKGMDDVLKALKVDRPYLFGTVVAPGNIDSSTRGGQAGISIDQLKNRKRSDYGPL